MNIKTYEINEEMAGLVPLAGTREQNALNIDVAENGLNLPIVLWQGKIVDGRCRQKACIEAGIEISTTSLPWDMTEEEVEAKVKSLNTRRNLTITQKSMSAMRQQSRNGGVTKAVAERWSITEQSLKNAKYIRKYRPDMIQALFDGESVEIIDKNGDSTTTCKLSPICSFIKWQLEILTLEVDSSEVVEWKEDGQIKTQAGKDWYYGMVKELGTKCVTTRMLFVELANLKFKDSK